MKFEEQLDVFQGREGFVESAHFDKHFLKNIKEGPVGQNFGAFSSGYS